jgi:hypothetical protein
MSPVDFSEAEIAEQSRTNALGLFLGTVAVLQDGGQSVAAWARALGERFAPSWDAARDAGAYTAARWAALNMVTGGAEIRSLEGDADTAEVTFVFPGGEAIEFADQLGISDASLGESMEIWQPIMSHMNLRAEVRQEGAVRRLVVSRD